MVSGISKPQATVKLTSIEQNVRQWVNGMALRRHQKEGRDIPSGMGPLSSIGLVRQEFSVQWPTGLGAETIHQKDPLKAMEAGVHLQVAIVIMGWCEITEGICVRLMRRSFNPFESATFSSGTGKRRERRFHLHVKSSTAGDGVEERSVALLSS
ncbi:hypothetical protein BD410DRAFT_810827 [Rickenella mellea]|uniref:Uncharacterized protein n=1 Tax=Rickenella mellea TaxID=50990 RepID=A0A4Y7PD02_9AGAM|nr:hypothetical protein BD410DRAFT_810827 [Rickenella mellea]